MTLNSTSIPAVPPPQGKVPNFEHPEDVLYTINLVSQILAVATVTPFVFGRLIIKTFIVPPLLVEDWVLVIAWLKVLSIGYSSTAFAMHHYGGGYHVWEIPLDRYEGFLQALYADTVVYGPNAYFTKIALLLVVARVFSTFRATKIATYALIVAMLVKATCFNQRAIFVADTVISAVTDSAVLILPIPAVISLRMPFKKKVKVWLMLGIGGIATGASFVRMVIVIRLQQSQDQTVDFVRFNLLGSVCWMVTTMNSLLTIVPKIRTAEVSIGLICACLPSTNILYSRLRHAWDSTRASEITLTQNLTSFSQKIKHLKFLQGSRLETADTLTNNNNTQSGDVPHLGVGVGEETHPIFDLHALRSHSTALSRFDADLESNMYPVPETVEIELRESMELGRIATVYF
ncbi:hypothetical protein DM02DRAFT_149138 [Periconia macrospinosa]|uniref:Rhodopsin domain-containing protein n=1 Tax=Periconia macrospinosa TaxID=97972 RepID=A0A2V1DEA8_9PLEO|nr:hypothetical protein DM02DRAFT_149138 [Periconia macrospinosa]